MGHLTCLDHEQHVVVMRFGKVIHREDGSLCDSEYVKISKKLLHREAKEFNDE